MGKELIEQLTRAVKRLEEVLALEKTVLNRDAAIKRFEMAFDLSWKVIKWWMEDMQGVICRSPKNCYREAFSQGLIQYERKWLSMSDDRNATVHTYKEALAEEMLTRLPEHLKLFQELLNKLHEEK